MPIPDYQTLMLPLLEQVRKGGEHRIGGLVEPLAKRFGLSETELAQLLPSGRQAIFNNKIHWAKTYLAQAKLVEITRRGYFRITGRGQELLAEKPSSVGVKLLERYPEFVDFRIRSREAQGSAAARAEGQPAPEDTAAEGTPDEVLRETLKAVDAALASELLQRVIAAPPAFFENLIVTLLLSMGYGGSREEAGRAIARSGDGGIDGVIDQDPLGLARVYLQAKRYAVGSAVSEPEIRGFSGSLGAVKASKGVFVTTSYFTKRRSTLQSAILSKWS